MLSLKFKTQKGTSPIEYAFLIALVIGALIGMQAYIKRPICQRWRLAGDAFGFGKQYAMVESPEPPPDPPVTGGKTLGQVYIDSYSGVSILAGVDIDLTEDQVLQYYNPLLATDFAGGEVFPLTPFEFYSLFGWGVAVEHGELYWINWLDGSKPHFGVIAIEE